MVQLDQLGAYMRRRGLKILYFLYVPAFVIPGLTFVVTDHDPSRHYTWAQSLWLFVIRYGGLLLFIPSLSFAAMYVFGDFPAVTEGPPVNKKPGTFEENNGRRRTKIKKRHLDCFLVRIITRGEYPDLIRRSANFHINLIEKYFDCDRLEFHVVTENPLDGDYRVGRTGRVREMLVPKDYRTKNGSMAKARNLAFWIEATSKDPKYANPDKIWLLTLDEDAFLTDVWMEDFTENFIPSGAHCTTSPFLMEMQPNVGFHAIFEECAFTAIDCSAKWLQGKILNATPTAWHGSAYVVRADVDREIGFDFIPHLSMAEDHAFGHYFGNDSRYKMKHIDGWNWEFGASSLKGLIVQRARWFRASLYSFVYQPKSSDRWIGAAVNIFVPYFVLLPCMACATVAHLSLLTGNFLLPAGARNPYTDFIAAFAFANFFFTIIWGAWYCLPTKTALLVTVSVFLWYGAAVALTVHFAAMIWTLITMAMDLSKKRLVFEVSKKG